MLGVLCFLAAAVLCAHGMHAPDKEGQLATDLAPPVNPSSLMADAHPSVSPNATAADLITKVFFINLDSSTERNKFMQSQLTALGIPFERKAACKVSSLSEALADPAMSKAIHDIPSFHHEELSWDKPDVKLPDKPRFVLSVCMSHLTLYQEILDRYHEDPNAVLLVLEDDAALHPDFLHKFPEVYRQVPDDWEILRLDSWGNTRPADKVTDVIYRANPPAADRATHTIWYGGAHAVLVRSKTLEAMLTKLKATQMDDVDYMMTSATIKSYVVTHDQGLASVDVKRLEQFLENSHPIELDIIPDLIRDAGLAKVKELTKSLKLDHLGSLFDSHNTAKP